ncbi:hypothetical protein ElyMa_003461600 [Elysia marginata]|uniref:Uncharacterized protein n=1 Tax=Elysia marginata TaxID=1093978 RepID=A0AAV4EB57_9GAST|nr:hypothetical protein ElyMa_003461600 [Elysia marginata]
MAVLVTVRDKVIRNDRGDDNERRLQAGKPPRRFLAGAVREPAARFPPAATSCLIADCLFPGPGPRLTCQHGTSPGSGVGRPGETCWCDLARPWPALGVSQA